MFVGMMGSGVLGGGSGTAESVGRTSRVDVASGVGGSGGTVCSTGVLVAAGGMVGGTAVFVGGTAVIAGRGVLACGRGLLVMVGCVVGEDVGKAVSVGTGIGLSTSAAVGRGALVSSDAVVEVGTTSSGSSGEVSISLLPKMIVSGHQHKKARMINKAKICFRLNWHKRCMTFLLI